ncbi:hypothetical protein cyc_01072 [Cyclospora cayetanensis]|uniref:Uncharacterized protein n=1 Tax=Cyclospora cayetanensis TaxID=88456 RepID=A0A1D3D393_9EIME|nr:hypothetical protein cyc_01072 [Cyclospora cayetanensis]
MRLPPGDWVGTSTATEFAAAAGYPKGPFQGRSNLSQSTRHRAAATNQKQQKLLVHREARGVSASSPATASANTALPMSGSTTFLVGNPSETEHVHPSTHVSMKQAQQQVPQQRGGLHGLAQWTSASSASFHAATVDDGDKNWPPLSRQSTSTHAGTSATVTDAVDDAATAMDVLWQSSELMRLSRLLLRAIDQICCTRTACSSQISSAPGDDSASALHHQEDATAAVLAAFSAGSVSSVAMRQQILQQLHAHEQQRPLQPAAADSAGSNGGGGRIDMRSAVLQQLAQAEKSGSAAADPYSASGNSMADSSSSTPELRSRSAPIGAAFSSQQQQHQAEDVGITGVQHLLLQLALEGPPQHQLLRRLLLLDCNSKSKDQQQLQKQQCCVAVPPRHVLNRWFGEGLRKHPEALCVQRMVTEDRYLRLLQPQIRLICHEFSTELLSLVP